MDFHNRIASLHNVKIGFACLMKMVLSMFLVLLTVPLLAEEEEEYEENDDEQEVVSSTYCYCSAKLNMSGFFQENMTPRKATQRVIFHNLLRNLYGNQPLFHLGDNSEDVVNLFKQVEARGIEVFKKISLLRLEDLGCIALSTQNEQKVFYHILKGGRGELFRNHRCILESLTKYIDLHSGATGLVNLYLAPKKVLLALFGNKQTVDQVFEYRAGLWGRLREERNTTKKELEDDFRNEVEPLLLPGIDADQLDFHLFMVKPEDMQLCEVS